MPADLLHIELIFLLLAIGAAGGFLSGMLGVGGGIVFVPSLFFCFKALGLDEAHVMHVAIGTSLAVVFATSGTSAFHHLKRGSVDKKIVRNWAPYIVLGVIAGSFFASMVDGTTLKKIFAGVMITIAVYMALSQEKHETEHGHKIPAYVLHLLCTLIGLISSMIGVGGAILNIPLMAYTGVPMKRAIGTGAALGMAVALPGMIGYMVSGFAHIKELPPLSLGYVNLIAVATIIPMSMLLSPVGVKLAHSLPKAGLRRIFAVVLALVALRMFMTL